MALDMLCKGIIADISFRYTKNIITHIKKNPITKIIMYV